MKKTCWFTTNAWILAMLSLSPVALAQEARLETWSCSGSLADLSAERGFGTGKVIQFEDQNFVLDRFNSNSATILEIEDTKVILSIYSGQMSLGDFENKIVRLGHTSLDLFKQGGTLASATASSKSDSITLMAHGIDKKITVTVGCKRK
jgi:hypothetical protein